jgi:hypothetical protein
MLIADRTGNSSNSMDKARRLAKLAFGGLLAFVALMLLAGCSPSAAPGSSAHAQKIPTRHVYLTLSIVPNKPGGPPDWPAYLPSTDLTVPAHSIITVTIRNYDLGYAPLVASSPFAKVQGTLGGVAYANGHAYTSLNPGHVAHTFTVFGLNLNVPIPGDAAPGKKYAIVTFSFNSGGAGTYIWRCNAPCGTGSSGWYGPMVTKGYMLGTLTVQG